MSLGEACGLWAVKRRGTAPMLEWLWAHLDRKFGERCNGDSMLLEPMGSAYLFGGDPVI